MLVHIRLLKYFSVDIEDSLNKQRIIYVVINMTTKLKMVIVQIGIKQTVLAAKIGMSPTALNMVINGKSYPNVKTALRIARELGVTVEYLWGEDEES